MTASVIDPEQIKGWIEGGLACEHVEVAGDGSHFEAIIVSPEFRGKSRVQRHQLVYSTLGGRMRGEIHALSIRAYTPEDWSGPGAGRHG